jgi:hypothetical protein
VLQHDRGAGDSSGDRRRADLCAAKSLRHLEEHGALLQSHVARASREAEVCLRADAGERVILKEQFRARFDAGLKPDLVFDDFVQASRPRARIRVDHHHFVDDLIHPRLGQRTGTDCLCDAAGNGAEEE